MIEDVSKSHESLQICTRLKRKTPQYFIGSLSLDRSATGHATSTTERYEVNLYSHNKEKETSPASLVAKQTTVTLPLYSMKWDFGRCKFIGSFKSSFLFFLVIMTFKARSIQVHGFSSSKISIGSTKMQFPSTREHDNHYTRNFVQSFNIGNFGSALFSNPPVVEQEAAISLEWIEYYSPETESELRSKRKEQKTPVLFLHGLLGSKRNFATCANMLAVQLDKKRRIMGVDLRNHGDTQPWSDKSKWEEIYTQTFLIL